MAIAGIAALLVIAAGIVAVTWLFFHLRDRDGEEDGIWGWGDWFSRTDFYLGMITGLLALGAWISRATGLW
jgi:hypothetical protein